MKLDQSDDVEMEDATLKKIANRIKEEAQSRKHDNSSFETELSFEKIGNECSTTLLKILSFVSKKFDSSLTAATIGSILTSVVTNQPTPLQVAVGVLIRNRSHIEVLNKLGITCTYDEILVQIFRCQFCCKEY